ncbi:hypothetical protein C436_21245 [Haloarcula marismortui ATCC 33800]|uniref:Uncharacterized protein n=1 Tax=Haloarcula marismortui ATCC 33800 TaxID=662476 RepID=M0JH24_9EURY|nr:hypothetical protein C436_21245 [Haloarcula sinaiiensis ATCC 33800]
MATVNPTNGAEDWFSWTRSSDTDPVALDPENVRAMFEAAITSRDRMLVVHVFGISSSTNHYLTDMLFGRQYCKARQL